MIVKKQSNHARWSVTISLGARAKVQALDLEPCCLIALKGATDKHGSIFLIWWSVLF